MRIDPWISAQEARQILKQALRDRFQENIGEVVITSCDKAIVVFTEDGYVETVGELRHKVRD